MRQFYDFWEASLDDQGQFLRRSLDPTTIPRILPWLMILERDGPGLSDFRYRLCGTGLVDLFKIDYTGRRFGDLLPPEAAREREREFDEIIRSRRPILSETKLPLEDRSFIAVFRGVFPAWTRTGGPPDQLVVVFGKIEQNG